MSALARYGSPDDLLEDPAFAELKDLVIRETGLSYYRNRDKDLALRVYRRLSALALPDCAAYLAHLSADSGQERAALVAALTVGETYFFRFREQFEALRDRVLPEIIERNRGARRLRIWSAGAASGPEPYSISILLHREFKTQLSGWDVRILATDINRESLEQARRAVYGDWALRALPEEQRRECFTLLDGAWKLKDQYREGVAFDYLNLVEQPWPAPYAESRFDLILCRNVMIYFSAETIRQVVAELRRHLAPRGWLVVGHAEVHTEVFRDFSIVNVPGATLYQLPEPGGPSLAQPNAWGALPAWTAEWTVPEASAATAPPAAADAARSALPAAGLPWPAEPPVRAAVGSTISGTVADLRRLADEGDWAAASTATAQLLEREPLAPAVHFYHALVREHLGDDKGAEQAYRRAIYLDRGCVLAHYHLALLLMRMGKGGAAVRAFANAVRLLDSLGEEEPVPLADDLTSAQLRRMAQLQLAALTQAGSTE